MNLETIGCNLFLQQIVQKLFSNEARELINKRWQHNMKVLTKVIHFLCVASTLD